MSQLEFIFVVALIVVLQLHIAYLDLKREQSETRLENRIAQLERLLGQRSRSHDDRQ